jgi:nitrogen-specific signal transduction histidine kinase
MTILAISLIRYIDARVATDMLEKNVRTDTVTLATELAADISGRDTPLAAENIRPWISDLVETNSYLTRIEVFYVANGTLNPICSTGQSASIGEMIDEMIAVQQAHTAILQQYKDRERTLKVIVPFRRAGTDIIGCVSVSSSLAQADNALAVHRRIDLFLIPASVLFLVLMLHFLFTRGLTGRIGRLGLAMIHARGGTLEKRAPVERQDELGAIAQLFNQTMEEIERASRERDRLLEEQKDFNTELQAKVREATKELSSANLQLRQVNQELIDAQRRLTRVERMALAGQMAAAFAHEIGSPLSAISTHLELMAEEPNCSEDARRRIQLIQQQMNRMTGFIEELLSETRAAARAFTGVQLNDILKQLLLFLGQHLDRQQIRLETLLEPDLPEIEANAQQLQQVFLNLLNNAADAMPDGGTIRVETRAEKDENGKELVAVSVSDSGIGISQDEQKRIFEPFFSTKDLRQGAGLGLSIAARIVREHEGTIELASEPGAGTTFTIRFPAQPAVASVSQEEVSTR